MCRCTGLNAGQNWLTCLTCLRPRALYVLLCLGALVLGILTSLHVCVHGLFVCLRAWHACVLTCLVYPRDYIRGMLVCFEMLHYRPPCMLVVLICLPAHGLLLKPGPGPLTLTLKHLDPEKPVPWKISTLKTWTLKSIFMLKLFLW